MADHLIGHAPAGMSHVYLVTGGSEAMARGLMVYPMGGTMDGRAGGRRLSASRKRLRVPPG